MKRRLLFVLLVLGLLLLAVGGWTVQAARALVVGVRGPAPAPAS